ncbi:hypothetical protein AAFC00_005276 [Neodothiora populina]|uniref:rRNA biogenesis protein RRP36 n=1 Tax=Neodothiora populina TaxID=2781224 RepID=A0ABR3PKJ8_9PEZI
MPLPLNERVKARPDPVQDEIDEYESDDSAPSVLVTGDDDDDNQILTSGDEDDDVDDDDNDGDEDAQNKISSISFGTLAKAQESLSKKRKRGSEETPHNDDKLEALRARLRELRESKGLSSTSKPKKQDDSEDDGESKDGDESQSDDSDDEEEDGPPKSRSSKHAPGSQTSKRQVTRKRTVIDAPKRHVRDPRFGPIGGRQDEAVVQKHYAFLNDYQESEMNELKAAIKKTKNEDEKDMLKRRLLSMESKKKAREKKEREQEVLRQHRKKEKEAINQGKNPYFLKRSDQKQLALVEKFNSMKGKDREKLIQRRTKKVAGKEKKMMPQARRVTG